MDDMEKLLKKQKDVEKAIKIKLHEREIHYYRSIKTPTDRQTEILNQLIKDLKGLK